MSHADHLQGLGGVLHDLEGITVGVVHPELPCIVHTQGNPGIQILGTASCDDLAVRQTCADFLCDIGKLYRSGLL